MSPSIHLQMWLILPVVIIDNDQMENICSKDDKSQFHWNIEEFTVEESDKAVCEMDE